MTAQPTAREAYAQRLKAINQKLHVLGTLAHAHFGHDSANDPDAYIHWGHVGDLERIDSTLADLLKVFGAEGMARTKALLDELEESLIKMANAGNAL